MVTPWHSVWSSANTLHMQPNQRNFCRCLKRHSNRKTANQTQYLLLFPSMEQTLICYIDTKMFRLFCMIFYTYCHNTQAVIYAIFQFRQSVTSNHAILLNFPVFAVDRNVIFYLLTYFFCTHFRLICCICV